MQLEEMLSIVRVLSNSCWVRWWAHWNWPQETGWKIAFSAMDENGNAANIDISRLKNYEMIESQGQIYYVFLRLDKAGNPYQNKKFL